MAEKNQLTVDSLVTLELQGKSNAIARYDQILWRIRTGYAVLLYGATGVIAGLVNNKAITLTPSVAAAAIIVIVGFSFCGALMDRSFMIAKIRVVNYRDRLVILAYKLATGVVLDDTAKLELTECLKNSGERNDTVDWSLRAGRRVPMTYYGGTGLFCIVATVLLLWR